MNTEIKMLTQKSREVITVEFSVRRLSSVWNGMISRCYNEKSPQYKNYGGRGITVCDSWKNSFAEFAWFCIRSGYKEDLCINRINNDSSYNPRNVNFVTYEENNNNKRNNTIIKIKEESLTISQWSKKTGICKSTISKRLKAGYSMEQCLKESLGNSSLKNIRIRSNGKFRLIIVKNKKKLIDKTFESLDEAISIREKYKNGILEN